MEKRETPIVIVACHFSSPASLCPVTHGRIRAAIQYAEQLGGIENIVFFVTGNVPFDSEGNSLERKTLAERMRALLLYYRPQAEVRIGEGVETFSESRTMTKEIAHDCMLAKKFCVVSSEFYFLNGRSIWARRAQEQGLGVEFVGVRFEPPISRKIWMLYAGIALVVRTARFFWCERLLENYITKREQRRKLGFTMNGCGINVL